jgi:putative glutamine amidotransferase
MPRKCLMLFFSLLLSIAAIVPAPSYARRIPIGLIYSSPELSRLREGDDGLSYYRKALELAGGSVVVLSPALDKAELDLRLSEIAGLLLPGGIDVDPKFFKQERHPAIGRVDTTLDEFEFSMVRYCMNKKLPILGVCRGEQVLAVYFGGTLYQDIPSQCAGAMTHKYTDKKEKQCPFHPISIEKNSLLFDLFHGSSIVVNSSHHQAVKKLPEGFMISARSPDGIIEAIESEGIEREGGALVLGVQFHPEWLRLEDPRFDTLFGWLVREAERRLVRMGEDKG